MKKYYIAVLAAIVAAMFVLPADARSKSQEAPTPRSDTKCSPWTAA
jgi:hypothetical protein